jgi:hypothetical protein
MISLPRAVRVCFANAARELARVVLRGCPMRCAAFVAEPVARADPKSPMSRTMSEALIEEFATWAEV